MKTTQHNLPIISIYSNTIAEHKYHVLRYIAKITIHLNIQDTVYFIMNPRMLSFPWTILANVQSSWANAWNKPKDTTCGIMAHVKYYAG